MMQELRFDNRVAVITGAGRGLGRSYAMLLASRGAKILVNDTGASLGGSGIDTQPAEGTVKEIRAAGGEATACFESVATAEGGTAIIQAALAQYGRIDILIHNAGNTRHASMKEMTQEDFDAVLSVHLRGAFHVARPAFPLMCKAGYGRIVLTSSTYHKMEDSKYRAVIRNLIQSNAICQRAQQAGPHFWEEAFRALNPGAT